MSLSYAILLDLEPERLHPERLPSNGLGLPHGLCLGPGLGIGLRLPGLGCGCGFGSGAGISIDPGCGCGCGCGCGFGAKFITFGDSASILSIYFLKEYGTSS